MAQPSRPVIAMATTADVTMTMGSWKGTASQESLPHMSAPLPGCLGGTAALGRRAGTGREHVFDHLVEKLRRHGPERRRRQVGALPRERRVRGAVERRADAARR